MKTTDPLSAWSSPVQGSLALEYAAIGLRYRGHFVQTSTGVACRGLLCQPGVDLWAMTSVDQG